ncbi:MAG: TolC family protein [Flavobacteriales bacterium]
MSITNRPQLLLLSLLFPLFLQAQNKTEGADTTHRMSIRELQRFASEQNHRIRIARKEVKKARKDVQATTAIGLPQISASGNYQNYIDRPVNLIPGEFFGRRPGTFAEVKFGTEHNARYRFQAEQLIFDGSYFVGLKASKAYRKMSKERSKKQKQEVKEMVGDAYINTLAAKEEMKSLSKTLANLRDLYKETKAMYEEGLTDRGEKDQLERTVINMENSLRKAKKGVERAERSLKILAGMPLKDSLVLTDSLKGMLERTDKAKLLGEAFQPKEHIDHRIASTQVRLKQLNYQNEQADFLPKFNAFFNYQEKAQRDEFNFFEEQDGEWYPQTVAGVRVSIPIFNSGRKLFQAQKAKVDRLQAEVDRERVSQQLKKEYRDTRSRFVERYRSLENRKKALELSQGILQRTIQEHQEGMSSSLEVTQTKNQYLKDRRAYIRSLSELLQARNQLKEILGRY